MITKEYIEKILKQYLDDNQMFLVDLKISANNDIKIEADKLEGKISIDDCAGISRHIESFLDRDVEDFSLEVSSPGITRPFKVKQQYLKNIGSEVTIITDDGTTHQGVLQAYTEDKSITLQVKRKINKKEIEQINLTIPIQKIKKTKKIVKF